MNTQHLHQPVARAFHKSVKSKDFTPLHLTTKALNDDSCWDEFDSEYEESLPSHVLSFFGDTDFE